MPSYKLYYFDGRGRAELSRLIFAAAGQTYEDVRFAQDQWPSKKAEFDFGQLPALDVDGVKVGQSAAIANFLATQLGLVGKTPLEAFKSNMLAETARDLVEPLGRIMFEKDEERKKKAQEEFETVTLKNSLEKFEKYVEKHGSKGFLVGDSLTYADLAVYHAFFTVQQFLKRDPLSGHPHLTKFCASVQAHPKIAAYLAKRKETPW